MRSSVRRAVLVLAVAAASTGASVVYDNRDGYRGAAVSVFGPKAQFNGMVHGDEIAFGGTDRRVTAIDWYLADDSGVNGILEFSLFLFANDGDQGVPQTQLWGGTFDYLTITGTVIDYKVPVPGVQVPDIAPWAVQVNGWWDQTPQHNPITTGNVYVLLGAPPTVGDNYDGLWINVPAFGGWIARNFGGFPPASFVADIEAAPAPEPAGASAVLVGAGLLLLRRRR